MSFEYSVEHEIRLIHDIKNGNASLFSVLVRRYQSQLISFIISIVRNETDAEDICQETFFKAFRAIGTYREKSKFSTWLFAIAHNTALSHLSRKKSFAELDENLPASGDDPFVSAENSEMYRFIDKALSQLPEIKQSALYLYYRENMSYDEIAKITETPLNTIKSHISRGKKMLKTILEDEGFTFEED